MDDRTGKSKDCRIFCVLFFFCGCVYVVRCHVVLTLLRWCSPGQPPSNTLKNECLDFTSRLTLDVHVDTEVADIHLCWSCSHCFFLLLLLLSVSTNCTLPTHTDYHDQKLLGIISKSALSSVHQCEFSSANLNIRSFYAESWRNCLTNQIDWVKVNWTEQDRHV